MLSAHILPYKINYTKAKKGFFGITSTFTEAIMADRSTNDLYRILNQVQNVEELNEYLAELRKDTASASLSNYLNYIMHAKKLALHDVVTASGLEQHYAYQIINGKKPNPSRVKVLALCIACHMTLAETQHALAISQNGVLYPRSTFDAIIIFHLNQEDWSVYSINERLHLEGLPIIE